MLRTGGECFFCNTVPALRCCRELHCGYMRTRKKGWIAMSSFDLPKKVQVSSPKTPPVSQADLSKLVHEELNRKKRIIQKIETDRNGLSIYDLTDSMRKRRIQAILNTAQEICRRFQAPAELQSYYAQAWCELNLPYITYSQMDVSTHILFAAAIWVLDQVMPRENWRELFFLLPKDDSVI